MGNWGPLPVTQESVNAVSLTFAPAGGPVNGEAHYLGSGPVCPDEEGQIRLDVVLQGSFDPGTGKLEGTAQWDLTNSRAAQAGSNEACQAVQDHWSLTGSFDGDLQNGQIRMGIGMPISDELPDGYYGTSYVAVTLTVQAP